MPQTATITSRPGAYEMMQTREAEGGGTDRSAARSRPQDRLLVLDGVVLKRRPKGNRASAI